MFWGFPRYLAITRPCRCPCETLSTNRYRPASALAAPQRTWRPGEHLSTRRSMFSNSMGLFAKIAQDQFDALAGWYLEPFRCQPSIAGRDFEAGSSSAYVPCVQPRPNKSVAMKIGYGSRRRTGSMASEPELGAEAEDPECRCRAVAAGIVNPLEIRR